MNLVPTPHIMASVRSVSTPYVYLETNIFYIAQYLKYSISLPFAKKYLPFRFVEGEGNHDQRLNQDPVLLAGLTCNSRQRLMRECGSCNGH